MFLFLGEITREPHRKVSGFSAFSYIVKQTAQEHFLGGSWVEKVDRNIPV